MKKITWLIRHFLQNKKVFWRAKIPFICILNCNYLHSTVTDPEDLAAASLAASHSSLVAKSTERPASFTEQESQDLLQEVVEMIVEAVSAKKNNTFFI